MSYSVHDGYDDAVLIDDILNKVLERHDTNDENNRLGYHALIRTIHTSLNIMRPKVGLRKTGTHMETVIPE